MGNRSFLFLSEKLTCFFKFFHPNYFLFFHSNSFAVDFLKHYTTFSLVIMSLLVCSHLSEAIFVGNLDYSSLFVHSEALRSLEKF